MEGPVRQPSQAEAERLFLDTFPHADYFRRAVREEIPPEERVVLKGELGRAERHFYKTARRNGYQACHPVVYGLKLGMTPSALQAKGYKAGSMDDAGGMTSVSWAPYNSIKE